MKLVDISGTKEGKAKIYEIKTSSKIKTIRDMHMANSDLKMGYQTRTNIVMEKKDNLVTDSHSIFAKWRNHFSQLFNVHGVTDIRRHIHIQHNH